MNKFKVGDEVVRTQDWLRDGEDFLIGYSFTVKDISRSGSPIDSYGNHHGGENCEIAWHPEPGEIIEVSALTPPFTPLGKFHYEFFAMNGDQYVCRKENRLDEFMSWPHARPIKKTHTITLEDGSYEVKECVKDTIVRICEANKTNP